jgi:hypothetical protein
VSAARHTGPLEPCLDAADAGAADTAAGKALVQRVHVLDPVQERDDGLRRCLDAVEGGVERRRL